MEHALITRARFPLRRRSYDETPHESLTGEKPDFSELAASPLWQRAIGAQNRRRAADEAGAKLTPAGVDLSFALPARGAKLVGKLYSPATRLASTRRSYAPFDEEAMDSRLAHPIDA